MYSFDHGRNTRFITRSAIWHRLIDVCLLVAAAVAAKQWIDGASYSQSDAMLIALLMPFMLILFSSKVSHGESARRVMRHRVRLAAAGSLAGGAAFATLIGWHGISMPGWLAGWFVLAAIGCATSVGVQRWLGGHAAAPRVMRRPVAVVGQGEHGFEYARRAEQDTHSWVRVAAIFDRAPASGPEAGTAKVHRDLTRFVECVRRERVEEVWIVLPLSAADSVGAIVRAFSKDLVDIRFMPDLTEMAPFGPHRTNPAFAPALDLVVRPLSRQALAGKAIFDRTFACFALLAVAPLMAVISIAVKLSSPGPVLFRQQRMGAYGRPFTIYKFRTMHAHDTGAPGEIRQATRGDPRVTRVGAWLRRTSFDELPQFINVLKGDMSVVGPRPHAVEHDIFYQDLVDGYIQRYRVKPGITGWAQVNGLRGETDRIEKMQRRVEHDLYYLRNWSIAFDVRIVLATLFHVKAHSNAY
ncbi:undecaprenyl-phosphate glucose phosphotransferase [Burkholderia sp. JKS000303]|uniref:undecaprenyl-phosphate glucose phosphotransferase n=1 Tax=Burkholderia sp. JKS000303 TaxID=1938747 RepID=UPI000BFA940B|nr:undecaprenyl-phosphate glucose phosphotransferase [Burkholderia sp. JKS000303]PFH19516.1 Undecaprenyl-phosphate glucose phosphotransferase [Burkholderia sp. JKS000303]